MAVLSGKKRIDLLRQLLSPGLNVRVHKRARNRQRDKKRTIKHKQIVKKMYLKLTVYNSMHISLKDTYV